MVRRNYIDTFEVDIRILSFVLLIIPFLIDSIKWLPYRIKKIPQFPQWILNAEPFSNDRIFLINSVFDITLSLLGVYMIVIYFIGPHILKRRLNLILLDDRMYNINEIVNKLSLKIGLRKTPTLYISHEKNVNCFVFGRNKNNANMVFSNELLNLIDIKYIKSIVLHELSHVVNRDMPFMTWGIMCMKGLTLWFILSTFTGFLIILIDGWLWLTEYTTFKKAVFMDIKVFGSKTIVIFIFLVFLPFLLLNSTSRIREHLADSRAILLLKDKNILISAFDEVVSNQLLINIVKTNFPNRLCFLETPYKREKKGFSSIFKGINNYIFSIQPSINERKDAIYNEKWLSKEDDMKIFSISSIVLMGLCVLYLSLVISNLINYFLIMPHITFATTSTANYLLNLVNNATLISIIAPPIIIVLNIYSIRNFRQITIRFIFYFIINTILCYISYNIILIILVNLPLILLKIITLLI